MYATPVITPLLIASFVAAAIATPTHDTQLAPSVQIKNGTIHGRYLAEPWTQDVFLGIPYAQPPVDELRFKLPKELEHAYRDTLNASQYGPSCFQADPSLTLSEDCLTLNVIRPHEVKPTASKGGRLPVLVWIYGGGLLAGSSADPQYNLSGIVKTSQDAGKPIVAVSFNYRLGVFGFLQSARIFEQGDSNAGLFDQRLALRWIKENIADFGGDPDRITIWGESAGAQSVAFHLHSFGGRNDDLYHGAIMESGGPVGVPLQSVAFYKAPADDLAQSLGCGSSEDQLACLRKVPAQMLNHNTVATFWYPIVDGEFLTDFPSSLAESGSFVKVPIITGVNTDEGISFQSGAAGSERDILNSLVTDGTFPPFPTLGGLQYQISPATASHILDLYPNHPAGEPPYEIKTDTVFPEKGLQWRRSCAIYGDIVMEAGRRKMCNIYSHADQKVFSYRFDTRLLNTTAADGVPHFSNVAFSFQDITGSLGPLPQAQSRIELSKSIGKAYINFVYSRDPNGGNHRGNHGGISTGLPHWPAWTRKLPTNMVLNATSTHVENDVYRQEGIDFLHSIIRTDLLS